MFRPTLDPTLCHHSTWWERLWPDRYRGQSSLCAVCERRFAWCLSIFLWGEGFFSHTQTHTQNNITEGLGRKIMNFRLKSYLTVTLADKLHLFPLEFCWKLGDGFSVRASCKKFMHFYESSQSRSFLTVNLPDAKSSSTCVVPTVSLCSLAWCIVNLLNSLSPFYTHICCCWIALIIQRK